MLMDSVHDFAHEEIPKFTKTLDNPKIQNIQDLIEFNNKHSTFSMPERKYYFVSADTIN
jgi:hypothetical protein